MEVISESHNLFVLFDFQCALFMHAQTQATVTDLMRQSDKVVRQKPKHLVHEPALFYATVPTTDLDKKG